MKTLLYLHGMGGGADSRIPSILSDWLASQRPDVRVVVRTYDFHPFRAAEQIDAWYEELQPVLVIGESLGANHALALYARLSSGSRATAPRGSVETCPSGGMLPRSAAAPLPTDVPAKQMLPPLLLVSPALNAPKFLYALRGFARIPAIHRWLNRIYKPREGDRQTLDFSPETLKAWGAYRNIADAFSPSDAVTGGRCPQAFFGRHDHYRRSGVVSIRQWRRLFGPDSYTLYDGTHFMEEPFIRSLLIPAILSRLSSSAFPTGKVE